MIHRARFLQPSVRYHFTLQVNGANASCGKHVYYPAFTGTHHERTARLSWHGWIVT